MANFKTHISFGAILAVATVIFVLITSLASSSLILVWIVAAVLVGSFLPDLDSDGGMPFQIISGSFSLLCAGAIFYYLYQIGESSWIRLILYSLIGFLVARFGAGFIFKKFTHHRGMFHSVPAILITGMGLYLILKGFNLENQAAIMISLAASLGYLGHLVLDEIYAMVNLRGFRIRPSRSLGSALKLFSRSGIANFVCYGVLIFLGVLVFL